MGPKADIEESDLRNEERAWGIQLSFWTHTERTNAERTNGRGKSRKIIEFDLNFYGAILVANTKLHLF